MKVQVQETPLADVRVVTPEVFSDDRGWFMEVFRRDVFAAAGLPTEFVQVNQSRSRRGVIRGLHFQWDPPMGKLMRVTAGRAFLVTVDIRLGSQTRGRWFGIEASADDRRQVWAPAGCARGFCALEDGTEVQYLCTGTYNGATEGGIRYDDPTIGIEWPLREVVVSDKDRAAPSYAEWLTRPESARFRV